LFEQVENAFVSDGKSILVSALMAQGFWALHTPCCFPHILRVVITVNFSPHADVLPRWINACKWLFLQEYLQILVFIELAYRKFSGICECVPPFTHSIFTRTTRFMSTYSPCTFERKQIRLLVHAVPLRLSSSSFVGGKFEVRRRGPDGGDSPDAVRIGGDGDV